MKKNLVLILGWVLLILSGCGWSWNVVEYNDNFVAVVKECTDSTQDLFNVYQTEGSTIDAILESLNVSVDICEESKTKASKLGDYDKDSSLKDAVVGLLSTEIEYLKTFWSTSRYRNIADITAEDKVAYDWVVWELYQMEEVLNSKFVELQQVQESFAVKHGLKLE